MLDFPRECGGLRGDDNTQQVMLFYYYDYTDRRFYASACAGS